MSLIWRCSCGEEWDEDGSGEGCGMAWRHQMDNYKAGTREEHQPIGLFDTETEEILQKSFSPRAAIAKGLIQKKEDSYYEQRKKGKPEQFDHEDEDDDDDSSGEDSDESAMSGSPGDGGSSKSKKKPVSKKGPLIGRVPIVQITIPPELYFLYVLAQSRFEGFGESPDDFVEWLTYCVFKLYTLYPEVFGFGEFLANALEKRGIQVGAQNE